MQEALADIYEHALDSAAAEALGGAHTPASLGTLVDRECVLAQAYDSHSAPLGWRSTYFPGGIFPTHSTPQQCYVVIA